MAANSDEQAVPPSTPPNLSANLPLNQPAHPNRNKQTETTRTIRTNGGTTGIDKLRLQIRQEMGGEFLETPFDKHLRTYHPFVPDDDLVNDCIERMSKNRANGEGPIITKINDCDGEAASYYLTDFEDILSNEKWTFSNLEPVSDDVGESIIPGRTLNFKLYDCPDRRIKSDIEGSTNKIDACFVPIDCPLPPPSTESSGGDSDRIDASFPPIETASAPREDTRTRKVHAESNSFVPGINIPHTGPPLEHHTANIPVACEWKLRDTLEDKLRNNEQVVSAMVQVMNDDVRRKFGFGVTIEKNMMRAWFFCRSHSAVSEPVDYVKNPAALIKLFMSFMFATKAEMGYDEMIERHANGRYTYEIPDPNVGPRFFRTIDTISEYRSNNITGRMARVWLVEEVESSTADARQKFPGRTCVLKDVWLDETAATEKQIQNGIFEDIESFWALPSLPDDKAELKDLKRAHQELVDNKQYQNYFLKIEADYTGDKTKQFADGAVRLKGLFDQPHTQSSASQQGTSTIRPSHQDVHPLQLHTRYVERTYARKKQYRVVFQENCTAFGKLKTLGEVMEVALQTLIVLQLMFCAGWVHRDISSGNILAYRAQEGGPWRAKLSDLEYAKRFPPPNGYEAATDPKTGTPHFMPNEILAQKYLGISRKSRRRSTEIRKKPKVVPRATAVHVVHNYQHDVESLWWTVLWTLTYRSRHGPAREYADAIFQNQITLSQERARALEADIMVPLSNCLPPELQDFVSSMEVLREWLWNKYIDRAEEDLLFDANSYASIHSFFQTEFEYLISQQTGWHDYSLRLHNPRTAGKTTNQKATTRVTIKRQRSEDSYKPPDSEGEGSESDASNAVESNYKRVKV